MNSYSSFTTGKSTYFGRPLLRAAAFAGILGLRILGLSFVSGTATAQAQTHCDAIGPVCGCDQCGHANSTRHNPLFKTLDTLAGGIEHVFGLDRCKSCCGSSGGCDSSGCGAGGCGAGGCGATGLGSPGAPMPPMQHGQLQHGQLQHGTIVPTPMPAAPSTLSPKPAPGPAQAAPRSTSPRMPSVPPLEADQTEPRTSSPGSSEPPVPSMTRPRSPAGSPDMSAPRIVPTPNETAPRLPSPGDTPPTSSEQQEGIFDRMDELDDPFKEDASNRRLPYGAVRPATLRRYVPRNGIQQNRPVPPIPFGTRNPAAGLPATQPIGSGLRPVQHLSPLRPVSNNQPIGLSPMGGGKVLQPYRRSK